MLCSILGTYAKNNLITCCYELKDFDGQYLGGDSGYHHTGA